MKGIHRKQDWLGRLLASDPGQIRFYKASRATISLITSVFTTLLILRAAGNSVITPAIVAGMAGMLGIMAVMDDTKEKMKVTTLLMAPSAMLGITIGSLSGNAVYIDVMMIIIIFCSFYLTRFGVRFFSLSMIMFMTVYISSVLKLHSNQLPWFFGGITIGILSAFLVNFFLFQSTAKSLRNSLESFHFQSNLTFNLLLDAMKDPEVSLKRKKEIQKNVHKLKEYAVIVSGYIKVEDVQEMWPGLTTSQLRLYVFDTGMLAETLSDSIQSLKNTDAQELKEIRPLLIEVTQTLRASKVLAPNVEEQQLEDAERAVQKLRLMILDLLNRDHDPKGWVFLIRRIESIANHVIEGATTIQQSLQGKKADTLGLEETEEVLEKETSKEETGLKPSTRKAFQALVAGVLSILVGGIFSPTQPYWVLLTAFIVLLGTESIGRIYTKGYQRSLGTIIGAVIGFLMAKLLSGHPVIEVILLFAVIFLAFYLLTVSYMMMSLFITMLIAFMYDILLGGITFELIGSRVLDTIAGASIALVVSTVVFPKKTKQKVAETIQDFFEELKPYVTEYVKSFREDVNVKELSEKGFLLDQKLQAIRDEAHTLLQRPGSPAHTEMSRWFTILSAINYYAKHLVASSYRKGFDYPEELIDVFKNTEEKLGQNLDALKELLKRGTDKEKILMYSLEIEREQIERLAPSRKQTQRDLIHHLFYVWRINRSLIELGKELGAVEK
ncbi:FUSC family protein [Fictibacillus phosphorivorans]|uniref:FUSC family protein n=1 Tax=Fictibacillus phosphorivorans TaxID=1221500 RepID=UPI00203A937F|nr:FUSC family protein [Fictibacillus phosphorivorans]MCM3718179.1 FUSC family protein [Fictibacillus phosphorivorans]MCM3775806.1 FUSC family protein [Fictibacillus phosphorivorans]